MPPARNRGATTREALRLDLLSKISASNRVVLELDEAGQSLQVWTWCVESSGIRLLVERSVDRPVNDHGERVTPFDLAAHRLSHHFLGPRCLCMLTNCHIHLEAAMVIRRRGQYAGEYVACCVTGRCGYFGEHLKTLISPQLLMMRRLPSTP